MLCDECKQRPAKVHITKIVDSNKTEINLCEECARKYQQQNPMNMGVEPTFSFQKFLAGLLDDEFDIGQGMPVSAVTEPRCDKCGMTYSEFAKTGRLGCDRCYAAFKTKLNPLLTRIHGNSIHNGKMPQHLEESIRFQKEVDVLRRELQKMVAEEKFEQAAEIRDRIRDLEGKLKQGGSKQ